MAQAQWKCIAHEDSLQRSSHSISVVGHKSYIFGGELIPREPRDNDVFTIDVNSSTGSGISVTSGSSGNAPTPRVGSASTALNGKVYFFSGRGGVAMKPVEEQGGLWDYNTATSKWTLTHAKDSSAPYPQARSYHCMANDGVNTIFVHAGCPETGRLSDLWSFTVKERAWTKLADAPAPQRGGTSIAFSGGRLYRMNGFDGKTEQGGSLDVYDVSQNSWSTKTFAADGKTGPEARSVGALLPVTVEGNTMLLTLFGERDPSSLGHAGAGKMLGDYWLYNIAKDHWQKGEDTSSDRPAARGWFGADVVDDSKIVVVGGLGETNERLNDAWILSF